MLVKVALLSAHPHPMQLSLKAVPKEDCSVCSDAFDVSLIFGCKQLLLHALLEGAVTAISFSFSVTTAYTFGCHDQTPQHTRLNVDQSDYSTDTPSQCWWSFYTDTMQALHY